MFSAISVTGLLRAYRPAPDSPPIAVETGPGLSVVSLNLATETDVEKMVRDLKKNQSVGDADVLLLQEVSRLLEDQPSAAENLASRLQRHVYYSSPVPGPNTMGLAILSRYPIRDPYNMRLKSFNLKFRSRQRMAIGVTVDSPLGAVRVFNTHLDTRISAAERVEQLSAVIEEVDKFSGPRLIGGDLNTNYMGWVARTVPLPFAERHGEAVLNYMTRRGYNTPFRSIGSTFDYLGMQLDWVYLNQLKSHSAGKQPMEFSDHHAIWTRVVK